MLGQIFNRFLEADDGVVYVEGVHYIQLQLCLLVDQTLRRSCGRMRRVGSAVNNQLRAVYASLCLPAVKEIFV